ncbi:predicted protein [Histoplasma capsulatum G186AR]|uniref:Uncharacterized protein n=1 Tax=Ajellomyces capsulatus (strain G186AR / H82 / ATCC MYA-2454 / RMSCC 2432) TaxID=447093 RepID=C0NB79_AJECG|nr:uncharacterized protein HCBG_00375 [Histoplasma capsulatum G186AR]EEH10920.1 predicted protein [Histoplasma capsulatum G186AR]
MTVRQNNNNHGAGGPKNALNLETSRSLSPLEIWASVAPITISPACACLISNSSEQHQEYIAMVTQLLRISLTLEKTSNNEHSVYAVVNVAKAPSAFCLELGRRKNLNILQASTLSHLVP